MSKLLLISTSYPDTNEGSAAAGVFVRNFAEECVRQGIETEIVAPSSRDAMQDENGVRVRRFAIPKQPLSLLSPARPADWPAILQTLRHGSRTVMRA